MASMGSGLRKICQENYPRKNYQEELPRKPQENCKQKRQEKLPRKMPEIAAYETTHSRNNAARDELARIVRWLAGAGGRSTWPLPSAESDGWSSARSSFRSPAPASSG